MTVGMMMMSREVSSLEILENDLLHQSEGREGINIEYVLTTDSNNKELDNIFQCLLETGHVM